MLQRILISRRDLLIVIAALALSVPVIVAPAVAYFSDGTSVWLMGTPAFWQGGLEALALLILLCINAAYTSKPKLKAAVVLVLSFVYLRLHNVDLPFLCAGLWLEGMLAAGALIFRQKQTLPPSTLLTLRFISGLVLWTLGAVALSAARLGTAGWLLSYTFIFFVIAFILTRRSLFSTGMLLRPLLSTDKYTAILCTFMLVMVLVLFARTNNVPDFDSSWYGLRGPQVLAPHHSFFDKTDLVYYVYYYPKLFELIVLPMSNFGAFSFTEGINIMIYVATGVAAFAFLRCLGVRLRLALLGVALLFSMPALTTMSLTAKPDNLANYLLLAASLMAVTCVARKQFIWALAVFSFIALAFSTKLTSIPFGGILMVSTVLCATYVWMERKSGLAPENVFSRSLLTLFGLTSVVAGALMFRTYYLTGSLVVGSEPLDHVLNRIGLHVRWPIVAYYSIPTWQPITVWPKVAFDYIFAPTGLAHVAIAWPGNTAFLFLSLATCFWLLYRRKTISTLILVACIPVVLAGFILGLAYGVLPGGDGNYYIFPIALGSLLGLAILSHFGRAGFVTLTLVSPAVIAVATYVGFLSGWGTSGGTEAFSFNLLRSPFDTKTFRESYLKSRGLSMIDEYAARMEDCRGVGGGDWIGINLLPCTVENFLLPQLRFDDFRDPSLFIQYLNAANINFLVIPKIPVIDPLHEAAAYLQQKLRLSPIQNDYYVALDLSAVRGHLPVPSPLEDVDMNRKVGYSALGAFEGSRVMDIGCKCPSGLSVFAPGPLGFFARNALVLHDGTTTTAELHARGSGYIREFTAAAGFVPQSIVQGNEEVKLTMEFLLKDGKVISSQSWLIHVGDYPRTNLRIATGYDLSEVTIRLTVTNSRAMEGGHPQLLVADMDIS